MKMYIVTLQLSNGGKAQLRSCAYSMEAANAFAEECFRALGGKVIDSHPVLEVM